MKLSVIILNYNVRHFLELCLQSVEAALVNIDSEIIVIDNLSSDESCDMVKATFPKIKLIQNTKNYGFSKGNNIGVAQAKGDYICILNPDTVVAEDTFETLLHFANQQSNLGILGCRLVDGQGRFLPESKRNVPRPIVAIKKILGFSKSYYVSDLDESGIGNSPVFVGAFMIMKRAIYSQVKGFDEDYFMYGEDIDLSYKVELAGYNNIYNGNTTIIHYKGESTLKDQTYANRFYGAMQIFYNKHFRSNFVFDTLVWLGIKLGPVLQKTSVFTETSPKQYALISSQNNSSISCITNQEVKWYSQLESYKDNTEYILDNNHLSFKSIIEILSNTPKNCTATFKILPKNSNFIIGSNSSKSRGAVIQLNNN
ncbi:glycosyltransferase family 2 protein [Psychroserpens ponticola]|uniref:Glycosyltransferase family 2 protein n=1 Tax=Psychroserpens ponticola TaxID=2932268 RepID=A0ABY7RW77_9FLAO|nr:glycosyltransferase family 2 protein [Psychroserpens ponticola]WCO00950.1 glycosyltransferase family 2 protein [Psychroserpens ponticola]